MKSLFLFVSGQGNQRQNKVCTEMGKHVFFSGLFDVNPTPSMILFLKMKNIRNLPDKTKLSNTKLSTHEIDFTNQPVFSIYVSFHMGNSSDCG